MIVSVPRLGFGAQNLLSNARSVNYPFDVQSVPVDSLRPAGSKILFYDNFSGSQLGWNQRVIGGKHATTTIPSFIRQTPLLAYPGSTGSLQIYAGTVAGSTALLGTNVTCDARRYTEFQGNVKLGCELWFTWLNQMNQEEGIFGACLSQMDGNIDTRAQLRMDNVYNLTRVDYETSQMAIDQLSSVLNFKALRAPVRSDAMQNGKWSHILLEADYTVQQPTWIRAILNGHDFSPTLNGLSLATQQTSLFNEGPKTGIEIFLYNQSVPVRGAEYFIGSAILYQLPS